MGSEGLSAAPRLRLLLKDPSSEVGSAAAEALGWIGDEEAIPQLLEATHSQHWLLVYQSAWSLGHLHAQEARYRLTQLKDTHWSYPVRKIAGQALDSLDKPTDSTATKQRPLLPSFQILQRLISEAPRCTDNITWRGEQLQLQTLTVWPPVSATGAWPTFIPSDARSVFPVEGGWLVGLNHGEFGGGLFHYTSSGKKRAILKNACVGGIYQTSSGLLATDGVDHMIYRPGNVFLLSRTSRGIWQAQPLVTLQAAPRNTAMTKDGTLVIQSQGAIVALTQGGTLEGVECRSAETHDPAGP